MKNKSYVLHCAFSLALSAPVFAFGSRAPQADAPNPLIAYQTRSLNRFAGKAGVDASVLQNFYAAIGSGTGKGTLSTQTIQNCTRDFSNNLASRNLLLTCLAHLGRSALNENLFFELESLSSPLYATEHTLNSQKSLFIIGLLEDLVRQNRVDQGLPASWFDGQTGFMSEEDQTRYPYQNGDVLLGMGNTSISSLISQTTSPQARFSHAFLMKKASDGTFHTLESLVETGVKDFPAEHFAKDPYNELWVTRWSHSANRSAVTQKAVAWAQSMADTKRAYDFKMNIQDDSKIFCSELAIGALMHGAGLDLEDLIPSASHIVSEPVFKFINRVGVENHIIPSPADLLASTHLKVLGKYRKTSDLAREWELFLMGDVFVERLERGADFDVDPLFLAAPAPVYLLQLFPSLLIPEARLIPKNIGPGTLAVMATTELELYRPAIKWTRKALNDQMNLIHTAPWVIRAYDEYWLDQSAGGNLHFKIR